MREGGGLEGEGREKAKIGSVLTLFLPSLPMPPPGTCPDPTQDGKVSSYHRRRLSKSTKRSDGSDVEKNATAAAATAKLAAVCPPHRKYKDDGQAARTQKLALRHPRGKGTVPW